MRVLNVATDILKDVGFAPMDAQALVVSPLIRRIS
jgi:hypothetical protein